MSEFWSGLSVLLVVALIVGLIRYVTTYTSDGGQQLSPAAVNALVKDQPLSPTDLSVLAEVAKTSTPTPAPAVYTPKPVASPSIPGLGAIPSATNVATSTSNTVVNTPVASSSIPSLSGILSTATNMITPTVSTPIAIAPSIIPNLGTIPAATNVTTSATTAPLITTTITPQMAAVVTPTDIAVKVASAQMSPVLSTSTATRVASPTVTTTVVAASTVTSPYKTKYVGTPVNTSTFEYRCEPHKVVKRLYFNAGDGLYKVGIGCGYPGDKIIDIPARGFADIATAGYYTRYPGIDSYYVTGKTYVGNVTVGDSTTKILPTGGKAIGIYAGDTTKLACNSGDVVSGIYGTKSLNKINSLGFLCAKP